MTDLVHQLRELGRVAEGSVSPVTPTEAMLTTAGATAGATTDAIGADALGADTAVDIGTVRQDGVSSGRAGAAGPARRQHRKRAVVLAISCAAALLAIAGLVVRAAGDDSPPGEIALAGPGESGDFIVPDDNGWAALRDCESNDDYTIDTGNTFYGAYQLTRARWRSAAASLGLEEAAGENPAHVAPHLQDVVAAAVHQESGADHWPICGRFIRGPMVTPVVAGWLGSVAATQTIVFLEPTVSDARIDAIGETVRRVVERREPAVPEIEYFDRTAAFDEFTAMFEGDPLALASIAIEDMPPSYRLNATLSDEEAAEIRAEPGVFEIVRSDGARPAAGPRLQRMTIPSLDLSSPIWPTPSVDHLARGASLLADEPTDLIIAGYGSTDGAVFARLADVEEGDHITTTTVEFADGNHQVEVVRSFTVDAAPMTIDVERVATLTDLLADRSEPPPGAQRLTLVADLPGQPGRRLVVFARPTEPVLDGYPVEADGG